LSYKGYWVIWVIRLRNAGVPMPLAPGKAETQSRGDVWPRAESLFTLFLITIIITIRKIIVFIVIINIISIGMIIIIIIISFCGGGGCVRAHE
jgi:hypothetical protein